MEKSRKINGWKAKNFKIKTEAGKHSRSNLLTTYDKVLRLQCILCSEGMYPASWELTIHWRMKKSRVVYCKKNFFLGGALSRLDLCAFFGSVAQLRFACLPLAFLDRWLNCADACLKPAGKQKICFTLFWIGQVGQVGQVGLKTLPRRHA